jgi:hypothetical protein
MSKSFKICVEMLLTSQLSEPHAIGSLSITVRCYVCWESWPRLPPF